MFGSKQPAAPKQPYAVFVLTPEYMVQGLNSNPEGDIFLNLKAFELKSVFQYSSYPFNLKEGQAFSAGRLDLPPQPFSTWQFTAAASVVAVLPGDDAALAEAQKFFHKKFSFPATVYAGPYVISGQILDDYKDHISVVNTTSLFFPMTDASVSCAIPGSQIAPMQTPMLVVNLYLTHGIRWA